MENVQLQLDLGDLDLGNSGMISVANMVSEFATTAGQTKNIPAAYNLVFEEFGEFADEYRDKASLDTNELKEMADLVYVVFGLAYHKGWDLTEAIRRVHANNMGRMFQEDGTIKRRDDGKILKNKKYPKVYLEDLV